MNIKIFISFILIFVYSYGYSQYKDSDVLFSIDNQPVTANEFIKVYNKNLDLVKDETQKDVDAYLELYVNYQLKVHEARRLGLQNEISYQREFTNYKKQLVKNYLSDPKVTEELVREAYDRISQDLKAVHILLRMDENESDTLAVYNRLMELRPRLKNENFESLRSELHDGEAIFVEDLGYFTGFKMVYPFETAAYQTEVGNVSKPFKTRFGYHIVKVLNKRPSRGSVTVSHIMIAKNKDSVASEPEVRIQEINSKLKQGENFESLAKQFSEDKGSAKKGGLLASFEAGQLSSKKFEDIAFGLNDSGDVSEPFESQFGWHIVKLIEKNPIPPYEIIKPELEVKVKRDSRSSLINEALVESLKSQYSVQSNDDQLKYFKSILNDDYFNRKWLLPENFEKDRNLAKIEDLEIKNEEFGSHLLAIQTKYASKALPIETVLEVEYKRFLADKLISFHEDNLVNVNDEFAFVLKEYREGLLLFDLMEKEVWNAAMKDTVGLKEFYDANKDNYRSTESFEGTILTAFNKKDLHHALEELNEGESVDEVIKEVNTKSKQKLISTSGNFDRNHQMIPPGFIFKMGNSEIFQHNDSYSVAIVNKINQESHLSLDDARGRVISDFQKKIEEDWLIELRKRFKVDVNKEVFYKVKEYLESQNG